MQDIGAATKILCQLNAPKNILCQNKAKKKKKIIQLMMNLKRVSDFELYQLFPYSLDATDVLILQ